MSHIKTKKIEIVQLFTKKDYLEITPYVMAHIDGLLKETPKESLNHDIKLVISIEYSQEVEIVSEKLFNELNKQ